MYLVNISFHTSRPLYHEAIEFVKAALIPAVSDSGVFVEHTFSRILTEIDEECRSFALQMRCKSLEAAEEWLATDGNRVLTEIHSKYGENVVFFATEMEVLSEGTHSDNGTAES